MRGTFEELTVKDCKYSGKTITGTMEVEGRGQKGTTAVIIVNQAVSKLQKLGIGATLTKPEELKLTGVEVRYVVSDPHKVSIMVNGFEELK